MTMTLLNQVAADVRHESLDAKAFQLEQTAAQITTSALVRLNGISVAAVVIGLFLPLIALLEQATLW